MTSASESAAALPTLIFETASFSNLGEYKAAWASNSRNDKGPLGILADLTAASSAWSPRGSGRSRGRTSDGCRLMRVRLFPPTVAFSTDNTINVDPGGNRYSVLLQLSDKDVTYVACSQITVLPQPQASGGFTTRRIPFE